MIFNLKIKSKLLIVVLFAIHSGFAYAQVNYQNGAAGYSIPVFAWNDHQSRLSLNVLLNYSSGNGLKVNSISSNIGVGWSLIAGGAVSRITVGVPDDQLPKDGSPEDLTKYPPGYLYDNFNSESGCPPGLASYPIYSQRNHIYKQHNTVAADKELDKFVYQFNGRSGEFVLSKEIGDKGFPVGDSKVKISFTRDETMVNSNIRTTINSFEIQDENGIIYKFRQLEKTKVLKTRYCDALGRYGYSVPEFKNDRVYYEADFDEAPTLSYIVNTWYLTEMRDPFTNRNIKFNYEIRQIEAKAGLNMAIYETSKNYGIISYQRSISQTPFLTSISLPDGHIINLNYGDERFDLQGDKKLKEIDIIFQERFLAKYLLRSSYFIYKSIGEPQTQAQKEAARLCLLSVQKVGPDLLGIEPPTEFEYYTGSNEPADFIPPPFFHFKDIWGYYNGSESADFNGNSIDLSIPIHQLNYAQVQGLCFLRKNQNKIIEAVKTGYAKNGLLKKVKFATGGSLIYEYDDNKAYVNGVEKLVGGVSVKRTIATDGGYSQDCIPVDIVTRYDFINEDGNSSLWGVEAPYNKVKSKSYYKPEKKRYKMPIFGGCGLLGCCKYKYQFPGILSIDHAVDLTGGQKLLESLIQGMSIAGDFYTVLSVILNGSASSWVSLGIGICLGVITIIRTCFFDIEKSFDSNIYYNFNLNDANPLPIQFKRVVIWEEINPANGYTVLSFTSEDDYPVWENTNPLRSMKQRFAPWAYGLLKNKIIFNSNNNKVSEIQNIYDFSQASKSFTEILGAGGETETINTGYVSCKCFVERNSSLRNTWWEVPDTDTSHFIKTNLEGNDIRADFYRMRTGIVRLTETIERIYENSLDAQSTPSGNFLERRISYNYNTPTLKPSRIKTKLSNGVVEIEDYFYSGDAYALAPYGFDLGPLASNNVLYEPVSIKKYIERPGGATSGILQTAEKIIYYRVIGNGDVKPSFVREQIFNEPVIPGSTTANYITTQTFKYDSHGNLINIRDEGDRMLSYIYDYNDRFVVATIVNADQIFGKTYSLYTSFETENLGGWQIEGGLDYNSDLGITGKRSFNLNGENAIYASASHPAPYILSFWATSRDFQITNNFSSYELKKSAPTINGFTYYEFELPDIAQRVIVQGNTVIDELRLYPMEGRMKTSTYDPVIGKTSDCDENNRIVYYEYDERGRIRFVKDEHRNIVKMFEYNTTNQYQNPDCPVLTTVYYNQQISETFRKNDCEGEMIGTEVTYTVNAGTYSSIISQEHADQQALNEILDLGQAWANNVANGSYCIPVFTNPFMSQDFEYEGCDFGFKGAMITYSVPEGKYSSTISLDDAIAQAQFEIDANGQAYANALSPLDNCLVTYEPQWEGTGVTGCDGVYAKYQMQDMNPNSSTFGTFQWVTDYDVQSPDCGGGSPLINLSYLNYSNTSASLIIHSLLDNNTYYFTLAPNITSQVYLSSFPPGDYEITINMGWGSDASAIQVYNINQTGSSFYLPSVSLSTSASPFIIIYN